MAIVSLAAVDRAEANRLLELWGHRLGACRRPFGQVAYVLTVDGAPVSLAISASTVSPTVAGFRRGELVECARLCSAPGRAWATRVMVRLWREVCAPVWPYWPVRAAVSYSQTDHQSGDVYRFDGWEGVADPTHGRKTLWVYRYGQAATAPGGLP